MTQPKASFFPLRPRWVTILLFTFVAWPVGNVRTCFAQRSSDTHFKEVEVSGAGADVEAAKKDACRDAVRQVVGAYVNSKTRTENDELIEDKVISLSSGFVDKMEILKESQADGLVRIRIRATVRISKVLDSLKTNRISLSDVDGESLGAQLLTTADQKKGKAELIEAAFEGFPAKWFKASVSGKPRLGGGEQRGEAIEEYLSVTTSGFEAVVKDLPVVGKWCSAEGDNLYIAIDKEFPAAKQRP